ncbi:MAG TPA: two-component sensor histidine kinase [Lachnospiraceae bacterium]|nr:two-component sensor histidine kinase [Lachnospiraceae bacterium]
MKKFFRSYRFRIFLIIILIGIISSELVRRNVISTYMDNAIDIKTSEVTSQMKILSNHLLAYNYLVDSSSEVINAELNQMSSLYGGRVLIMDSNFKVKQDTNGISIGKYMIADEVMQCYKGKTVSNIDEVNGFIEIGVPIRNINSQDVVGVILISVSTADIDSNRRALARSSTIIEIILMCLILAAAYFASYIMTMPLTRITKKIRDAASYEDTSIVSREYQETEEIAAAINELQSKLRVLDESRQEFVSNVSHELKTPMTSIKVLADSLNMQEDAPIEVYKEFMQDISEEIDRENTIISDLLTLVKMDNKDGGLTIESVSVNAMLERILKRLGPIARKEETDLVFESNREVTASVDEVKMTLALTNLIENGIKYNRRPGWVKVNLDADHQFVTIVISDSGIGIPEDAREHIFERFYRVDKSHSREIGGTGLGLPITRKILLLHRGSIKVESVMGEGTTFTVRFPITYIG